MRRSGNSAFRAVVVASIEDATEHLKEGVITMPYKNHNPIVSAVDDNELCCPSCGSGKVRTEEIDHCFPYGEGTSAVELSSRVPLRKCQDCGEEYLDNEAEELMHEAVCLHLGVMNPREVRDIRRQCGGLSRVEFARITRLGEATVGRWERGELIQNAAYDQFLHLLTYPENLIRLQEKVNRARSKPNTASASWAAKRFRVISVTADLTEQAARFDLNMTGAA